MKKFLAILVLLQACDVKVDGNTLTPIPPDAKAQPEDPAKAKAEASAEKAKAAPIDELAPIAAAIPTFCIPHELRDDYHTPIPTNGALYAALVHDGYTDRLADPKCYLDKTVASGGRLFIPCAVTLVGTAFGSGPLYGRMWAASDRVWVTDAFGDVRSHQTLTADELVVTNGTVDGASPFHADATLAGQALVTLSVDTAVTFNGYCQ